MFDSKPKIRLVFSLFYILVAAMIAFDIEPISPTWLKVLAILFMVFGFYISVVKSGILADKNARNIKNSSFDIVSIALVLLSVYKLIILII